MPLPSTTGMSQPMDGARRTREGAFCLDVFRNSVHPSSGDSWHLRAIILAALKKEDRDDPLSLPTTGSCHREVKRWSIFSRHTLHIVYLKGRFYGENTEQHVLSCR